MHFNSKYIFKGDTKVEIIGKINYNFDQILSFAIGPDGHQGAMGATGIFGPAGRRGATGADGIRASNWYKQPTEPSNPNTNDIWIDNSISDGNIKVFNYPVSDGTWNNSGYTFLSSKYFQSYSNILGPGGATDKYAIGFKYPNGITASSDTSLIINDSDLSENTSNPNNSKVLISTKDQIDRPIMAFSKNGAVSDDVPSFYWNSTGNDAGLKFDSGGSLYVTSDMKLLIDSDLARTLMSSSYCTFRSNNGSFTVNGDGDFTFATNSNIGTGSILNINSYNFLTDNVSVSNRGGVTITSPLTSTYILSSNPSSPSYNNGISIGVKDNATRVFEFNDYTGNPILHGKPSGPLSSGGFAQTVFGSTGGFTGGTGGPFAYHVRKVREVRQPTTNLSATQYLTTTTSNLVDVFDVSTNTMWENDNIIITPTAFGSSSDNTIGSFKVGDLNPDFNYSSAFNVFGSGFKNSLTGLDQYNAVVNDVARLSDGTTIFVGNFKYYNDQPVKTGSLTNTLGVVKVNPDGTMDTTFRSNISAISLSSVTSVNGIVNDESGSGKIYIYGCFTHNSTKNGIICLSLNGSQDTTFNSHMGNGVNSGATIYRAAVDPSDNNIFAIGNFSSYQGNTRNKMTKIKATGSITNGACITTFLTGTTASGPGFVLSTDVPYCFDFTPSGIVIGGSFGNFRTTTTGTNSTIVNVIEVSKSTGLRLTSTTFGYGFTNMTSSLYQSTDPVVSAIKYNSVDGYIYMGGSFSKINSTNYGRFARFTTSGTAFTLDTTLSTATGFNDIVTDFAFGDPGSGDKIYVGGRFTTYRGSTTQGFVRLNTDGSIDSSASIYHNTVSPGTIQGSYTYPIGLVRKLYLDIGTTNEFLYVGGFLNTILSSNGSGGGIYLKVPSSLSSDYLPVYTDGTTTNYRVFLNDPSSDPKLHYIRGLVFDAGLPTAVTSYVDISPGVTGCQYIDLMWVSKSSTTNISPRLFYKNCQGFSGYLDFGSNGVYSTVPPVLNTSQSVTVTWELNKQQTGSCSIYKNGTGFSNLLLSRTTSGNGTLPFSIGDKIYSQVNSGGSSGGYIGVYSSLIIRKTSLSTGVTTTEFVQSNSNDAGSVNNFSNPVTLLAGYSYYIQCDTSSQSTGGGCCFVGDTQVTMYDGSTKNISEVLAGEVILTYNIETGVYEGGSVTSIESPIKDDIIEFILSDGKSIKGTTEHPFWVIDKGWSSYSPERTMSDHGMTVFKLSVGDLLLDEYGNKVELLSMNDSNDSLQRVYNVLMSEGNHTYYANGILVHNKLFASFE